MDIVKFSNFEIKSNSKIQKDIPDTPPLSQPVASLIVIFIYSI